MFALAFWDERHHKLFLFRDRLGVKPLYYGWDGTNLLFGSELKAVRAFRACKREINREALGEFFSMDILRIREAFTSAFTNSHQGTGWNYLWVVNQS